MSKLKVIQLLPELNIGGVERGTKDFSSALVQRGHESIVISNGGIFEKDIRAHGAKHISLPIHKKSLFSYFLSNKLKTIYEEEKTDIVHVRSRMPEWINYFEFKKFFEMFKKLNIIKDLGDNLEVWKYEKLNETDRISRYIKSKLKDYDIS